MICSAKSVLTEVLEELSVTRYLRDVYTWRKAKHIHKRQTHPLVRGGVTYGLWPQGFSWKNEQKTALVVSVKGFDPKTNWLAVNRQS
jgi:hypothetical protein